MSNSLWPHGRSTPGFPVLHYLRELAQTHVRWVCDTIWPNFQISCLYLSFTRQPLLWHDWIFFLVVFQCHDMTICFAKENIASVKFCFVFFFFSFCRHSLVFLSGSFLDIAFNLGILKMHNDIYHVGLSYSILFHLTQNLVNPPTLIMLLFNSQKFSNINSL